MIACLCTAQMPHSHALPLPPFLSIPSLRSAASCPHSRAATIASYSKSTHFSKPILEVFLSRFARIVQSFPSSRRMGDVAASRGEIPEMEKSKTVLRKRKVIEHVALFQMKKDFSEQQEKDMLDHLFTLQYQMRGIIAVSLGRIAGENSDGCTHGLLTRFPSVEALNAYYDSPIRWRIEHEYIIPHYHGLICVDYETEVEDDIIPIFRRGEAFEHGVEYMVLLQVKEGITSAAVQGALQSLSSLIEELGSLVVQHTSGTNFCMLNRGYTHGMVTRFPSEEAKEIFTQHPAYLEIVGKKFVPISSKILSLDFDVTPIGTSSL